MAAGSSRRFGSDKRLYRYAGNASGLLQQTLGTVLSLELPTVVVLRTQDTAETASLLGRYASAGNISVRYVMEPERGLGHSIAQCFLAPPAWHGALLFLGDMPRIKPATVNHMLQQFSKQPHKIHAPLYANQRGHPVLFPCDFFAELAKLSGDSGARALLQQERAQMCEHPVNDAGVLWDLDYRPAENTAQ